MPEACGLESEGAPFWWAGGFQSGDLTVLRSAWSDVEGLGRGLTHELTHRFVHFYLPGAPRWLNEGLAKYYSTMVIEDGKVEQDFATPSQTH